MINTIETVETIAYAETALIFHLITLVANNAANDVALFPDSSAVREEYAGLLEAANSAQMALEKARRQVMAYFSVMAMDELEAVALRNRIDIKPDQILSVLIEAKKEMAR